MPSHGGTPSTGSGSGSGSGSGRGSGSGSGSGRGSGSGSGSGSGRGSGRGSGPQRLPIEGATQAGSTIERTARRTALGIASEEHTRVIDLEGSARPAPRAMEEDGRREGYGEHGAGGADPAKHGDAHDPRGVLLHICDRFVGVNDLRVRRSRLDEGELLGRQRAQLLEERVEIAGDEVDLAMLVRNS